MAGRKKARWDGSAPPEMRRVSRIHMIGIGGSGMSGIAEVLLTQGYEISGSDIQHNESLAHLEERGAKIHIGHEAALVEGADVVVTSSAVNEDNPEYRHARRQRIPIVPRAEMLAEVMRFRHGIAVAGTHGKTTTTSMIATLLAADGRDPTFVIGGRILGTGTGGYLGESRYLVAEADESDASFLHLQPMITVVTNLEEDHLENYDNDFQNLCGTYIDFLQNLPFYGLSILCVDDPVLRELVPEISRQVQTYGFSKEADFRVEDFRQEGRTSRFSVHRPGKKPLDLRLRVPGEHNARNAAAVVAVAMEEEVPDEVAAGALAEFAGVDRRFQVHGSFAHAGGEIILVDDYGHHPTELRVTVESARAIWPGRRVLMAFQPHRYTRLRALYENFVEALLRVDALFMLEVYSAGEEPIPGIDSRRLCHSLRLRGLEPWFVPEAGEVADRILAQAKAGDIVLTQGAGNIGALAPELLGRLEKTGEAP